jgi:hypothetical protein
VTQVKNCPPQERSVGPGLNIQLYLWTILIDVLLELSMIFIYVKKKVLTLPKLLPVVKNRMHFLWGKTSLYKVMRQMGFKWKKKNVEANENCYLKEQTLLIGGTNIW